MSSTICQDCLYTESHEWIRVDGDQATVGITDYAQDQLSDIVYVELPDLGATFGQGENFAVVESVKAASDCYLAVSGEIVELNEALEGEPELVNSDPYGAGWFVRLTVADASELDKLMTPAQYADFMAQAEAEGGH